MDTSKRKEKKKRRRELKAQKQMLEHRERKFFYEKNVIYVDCLPYTYFKSGYYEGIL